MVNYRQAFSFLQQVEDVLPDARKPMLELLLNSDSLSYTDAAGIYNLLQGQRGLLMALSRLETKIRVMQDMSTQEILVLFQESPGIYKALLTAGPQQQQQQPAADPAPAPPPAPTVTTNIGVTAQTLQPPPEVDTAPATAAPVTVTPAAKRDREESSSQHHPMHDGIRKHARHSIDRDDNNDDGNTDDNHDNDNDDEDEMPPPTKIAQPPEPDVSASVPVPTTTRSSLVTVVNIRHNPRAYIPRMTQPQLKALFALFPPHYSTTFPPVGAMYPSREDFEDHVGLLNMVYEKKHRKKGTLLCTCWAAKEQDCPFRVTLKQMNDARVKVSQYIPHTCVDADIGSFDSVPNGVLEKLLVDMPIKQVYGVFQWKEWNDELRRRYGIRAIGDGKVKVFLGIRKQGRDDTKCVESTGREAPPEGANAARETTPPEEANAANETMVRGTLPAVDVPASAMEPLFNSTPLAAVGGAMARLIMMRGTKTPEHVPERVPSSVQLPSAHKGTEEEPKESMNDNEQDDEASDEEERGNWTPTGRIKRAMDDVAHPLARPKRPVGPRASRESSSVLADEVSKKRQMVVTMKNLMPIRGCVTGRYVYTPVKRGFAIGHYLKSAFLEYGAKIRRIDDSCWENDWEPESATNYWLFDPNMSTGDFRIVVLKQNTGSDGGGAFPLFPAIAKHFGIDKPMYGIGITCGSSRRGASIGKGSIVFFKFGIVENLHPGVMAALMSRKDGSVSVEHLRRSLWNTASLTMNT